MKEIFKYIILVLLVIGVFWGGYFLFFYGYGHPLEEHKIILSFNTLNGTISSKNNNEFQKFKSLINKIEKQQKKYLKMTQNQEYLSVSILNAFYASLFTAIAVILAIVGLISWNKLKQLNEIVNRHNEIYNDKLKQLNEIYNEIKDKVTYLHERKDLAKWVKGIVNGDKDITSTHLNLNNGEKAKFDQIKRRIEDDFSDEAWLILVLTKNFADNERIDEAINIIDYVENRDLLKDDIKPYLFHFKAQFYWKKYLRAENNTRELVEKSINYYQKSLKYNNDRDETHGNLAVVLIEYAHKFSQNGDKSNKLNEAIKHLKEVEKLEEKGLGEINFNTYYDLARAKILLNNQSGEISEEIKNLLLKAADKIKTVSQRNKFFDYLDDEKNNIFSRFSNWETLKEEIKKRVDSKKWLT